MHRKKETAKPRILCRVLVIVTIVAVLAGTLSFVVFAQNSFVITDGENVTFHRSFSSDPDAILDEAGIALGAEDTYTTAYTGGVNRITINRLQTVTVVYRGMTTVVTSHGEQVSELLDRMGLFLSDGDTLSCERDALTRDGMQIEIVHRGTEVLTQDEVIPFETVYYEDPTLEPDEEVVLVEGQDGLIHRETEISYENGSEISRKLLSESTKTAMVKRVVLCGINRIIMRQPEEKQPVISMSSGTSSNKTSSSSSSTSASGGVLTTAGGETYYYSKVLTCTATAYSCEGYVGYTYSGTVARVGAIAVDPSVIPLDTRLYIVTNDGDYVYGCCVAEDTGGSIKGNKVDLYFDTISECLAFGVRTCTVYVLD